MGEEREIGYDKYVELELKLKRMDMRDLERKIAKEFTEFTAKEKEKENQNHFQLNDDF
jgi:hypothetical protein